MKDAGSSPATTLQLWGEDENATGLPIMAMAVENRAVEVHGKRRDR